MNKKTLVRNICYGGAIAAIYAGLTLLLQAISFGPVQVRVSEALTLLPIRFSRNSFRMFSVR